MAGNLTDHYDPRKKVLRLSRVFIRPVQWPPWRSQHTNWVTRCRTKRTISRLRLRAAMVPAVNIGSYLGWILIVIGSGAADLTQLSWLGILVFDGGAVFALATLPVELNASARARQLLSETGMIMGEDEMRGVNTVLNAAAMTYVAALIAAILQMIYWISVVLGVGGRRRS